MSLGRRRPAPGGDPVEIELDGGPASPGAHEVVLRPAGGRGRWWAGGVVLAAVALVAVAVATGGDEASAPTTTRERPASTAAARVVPSSTAGTRPAATPAATTLPASFRIGEGPLLGEPTGLGLLVSTNDATYRVDLDTATVTRTPLQPRLVNLVVTPVGLLWFNEEGTAVLHPGGDEPEVLLPGAVYLGEGPPGRAWFRFASESAVSFWFQDTGGTRVQATMPREAGRTLIDGVGGLVAEGGGGVYRVAPDGSAERLAVGTLLAANGGLVLVRACDEVLRCDVVLVDVVTGEARPGPTVPTDWWAEGAALSPDGRSLVVVDADVVSGWRLLVKPDDGEPVDLGELPLTCVSQGCSSAPQWSPDARWLFWSTFDGDLMAWRSGLDRPVELRLPEGASGSDRPSVAVAPLERLRQLDGAG